MKLLPAIATSTLFMFGLATPLPALADNTISLEQALGIAKNRVSGDIVDIDVDFEDDNYQDRDEYVIKAINNNTVYDVEIDARTGSIKDVDSDDLDDGERSDYNAFRQSRISLNQAIQTASRHLNGMVIAAEFDVKNGKSIYEIDVLKDNQKYKVDVDAVTGSVLSSERD